MGFLLVNGITKASKQEFPYPFEVTGGSNTRICYRWGWLVKRFPSPLEVTRGSYKIYLNLFVEKESFRPLPRWLGILTLWFFLLQPKMGFRPLSRWLRVLTEKQHRKDGMPSAFPSPPEVTGGAYRIWWRLLRGYIPRFRPLASWLLGILRT